MNTAAKTESYKCAISSGVISLLLLVSQWSKLKESAYNKVDVILLLLCGIHDISEHKELSLESIKQRLRTIDVHLEKVYLNRTYEVAGDLCEFMSLFDLLIQQLEGNDDSSSGLLDRDLKNSVLGVFVRRSVQEYQRLSFCQLCRVHKRWASSLYTSGVGFKSGTKVDFSYVLGKQNVMVVESALVGGDVKVNGNRLLEVEALELAQMHGNFGHKEEGIFALQESIRMAHQKNTSVLLEYALGWLLNLQPMEIDDTLSILDRFLKNARNLKLPVLGMWGRLQEIKTLVLSGQLKSAVEMLTLCESDFSDVYTGNTQKLSQRSLLLALHISTMDTCGQRLASLFYSQLLYEVPEDYNTVSYYQGMDEAFAVSTSSVARYLFKNGKYGRSMKLLVTARDILASSPQSQKVLSDCMEEIGFDQAVHLGQFAVARQHLSNIHLFAENSAKYRAALLFAREGILQDTVQVIVERKCKNLQNWLLLAEVFFIESPPSALACVVDCTSYCEGNHLETHLIKLLLGQLQLLLGSPKACVDHVDGCLLHFYAQGYTGAIAKALVLKGQAELLLKRLNCVCKILSSLQVSAHLYQACSRHSESQQVQVLEKLYRNL
ncbi:anaphase-promoting complex subunit 5-like isoform X4 [Halichondria panicea]|uniref:anaphase-promoting complex subunit 5-like isoform X4 n=1 Tax=Halichondria panicea TaxID=6063 RepID=UPI00312B4C3B